MAILCKQCGRQYDVTLFQFGRTITCECGAEVTQRLETTVNAKTPDADAVGLGFLTPAPVDSLYVYIVRHGKTVWNQSGRLQGQNDVELNDVGREEARSLAKALAAVPFEAAYTSDLLRAAETAEIILAGREVRLVPTPALREQDYGDWGGKDYEEIIGRWPEQCAERERDRVSFRPPGGESFGELQRRIVAKMEEIASAHSRGNVLVVTHGGPAFVFISHVLAPDGQLRGNFTIGNCAINIAAHTRFGWKLQVLNDTHHLE